ncbi:Do family serine endopeptidase [Paludibacterium yongneupense]|uniref:Do family serine endopeptidase n=1 Tax=Paludibacterium yongneupense TaxID=400061 RepID=UPI000408796F|nr:Do family serine endopeptidase [Paludibacterium yongneupense]
MSLNKLILSVMLAASLLAGAPAAAVAGDLPDFTRIVEAEGRAVVNISTTQTLRQASARVPDGLSEDDPFFEFFRRFAPPQPRERKIGSLGSGFIISSDGYVLTNSHVVARADVITVTLTDKREFKARVIGSDARTDVALLKIDGKDLPVAKLGSSATLKVGEWVLAIGSPFGFENSVTSGIVSAVGRQLPDENYVPFIQTDAAVNPGNSGGPLFNLKGEVVGINSQIYSESGGFMGISFAVPIDLALDVSEQIKIHGKVARARLGVSMQEMNAPLAASFGLDRPRGALVNSVVPGGPADKAGLRPGDIVLAANGQAVADPGALQRIVGMARPGTRFALDVWRHRASRSVLVLSDELKAEDDRSAAREYRAPQGEAVPQSQGERRLGLRLAPAPAALLARLHVKFGLLVQAARAGAAEAGIRPGDVIVGVGGDSLESAAQLDQALAAQAKGGGLALQVLRNGQMSFVLLQLDRP